MARRIYPADPSVEPKSVEPKPLVRRLASVRGESMQEPAIEHFIRRGNAAVNLDRETDSATLAREFEERLADTGKLAFRVARGVLRNSADAEDVAQEAFLKAYRSFPKLRNRERFRAWLVRITWRLALDRSRSAKRREARETAWGIEQPKPSVERLAASSEFGAHLDKSLAELPEKLRIVLILTAIEGHAIQDVASLLGLPIGTVKSRIHFGRKQLAEKLQWLVNDTSKI